jgi:hypothetical protein
MVLVTDLAGQPLSTDVIVNAADGSVFAETESDDNGQVVVQVPQGGSVSAYRSLPSYIGQEEVVLNMGQTAFLGGSAPTTIVLQLGAASGEPGPSMGTMNVQTTFGPKENTSSYELITSCSATTSATANINTTVPGCTDDGLYDVLLVARGFNGELRDYQTLDNQPFSANGTATHNFFWPVNDVGSIPYTITNLPSGAVGASVLSTSTKTSHGVAMKVQLAVSHPSPSADITGNVTQAVSFGSEQCLVASVQASGHWRSRKRCGASANLSTLQFDASRLAVLEGAAAAAPAVGWEMAADGELGDELNLTIQEQQGNVVTTWVGRVAPTSSAGQVIRPEVPATLSHFLNSQTVAGSVTNVDVTGMTGFEEALANPDRTDITTAF